MKGRRTIRTNASRHPISRVRAENRNLIAEKHTLNWPACSTRILERCRRDPLFFSKNVMGGEQPWELQAEILLALRDAHRVAVRSGHGVGKTWAAARAAIWHLYCHPHSVVLTTAPTHRQVRSILWAEIRRQVRTAKVRLGGRLTETGLTLADDWFALGLATDEPERFQGYHAEHLLLILDEAPGVAPDIYEAARGLLTSRHARILLIGNPTVPAGPFYEAFRDPVWRNLHIPCTHCPNVTAGRVIYPKLVSAEWIETQRAEWGEDSPAFRARVLGEFPEESDSRLIPLAWLHAAQERVACVEESRNMDLRMGVDVARYGADQTVMILANEAGLYDVYSASGLSTMETAGRIIALAGRHNIPPERIAVDDSGLGGGVVDRLREQGWSVHAVNAASRPQSHKNFLNRRSELFWAVREALNPKSPQPFVIPPRKFDRLCRELSEITYHFNSSGRIQIESKDTLRARLGGSPDYADALALTFAARTPVTREPRIWEV